MEVMTGRVALHLAVAGCAGLLGSADAAGFVAEKIYPLCVHLGRARIARADGEYANFPTVRKVKNMMIILLTVIVVGGICGGVASGVTNLLINRVSTHPIATIHAINSGVIVGSVFGVCFGSISDPILRFVLCILFQHAREIEERL
jgi:hypothetical protein